ncbi:hypothetical protein HY087_02510 [Candidatus Gottesmanbacteria bacterium]|nr:hypothetical protein [Candidatus Gottesmanbacteria bacterium]
MRIYIDQSGKVEQTSKDTVVALSNESERSILIKASEKRLVEEVFRKAGKPEVFVYRTFTVLMYLLVRDELEHISELLIDREYVGKESTIKHYLLEVVRRTGKVLEKDCIGFTQVGKQSTCHKVAIETLRGRRKPDKVVTARDVLRLVF